MITLAVSYRISRNTIHFMRSDTGRIFAYAAMFLLAALFVSMNIFSPNSYNNVFLQDTLYLLNSAYLVLKGYVPHIDFGWQFGGFETYLTALAFSIFGVSFKALEQGAAFAYVLVLGLLCVGIPKRTNLVTMFLLFSLVSATVLTRFPFENGVPNLEQQTFSMLYNRICWALSIVLFSALLLCPEARLSRRQVFVCGSCIYLILLTKITFALLFPLAAILIWRRNGWSGVAELMLGIFAFAGLAWLFLGYEPAAYVNAITDILDTTQNFQGLRFGPISKLLHILVFNIYVIIPIVAALVYVGITERGDVRRASHSITLLTLLGLSLGVSVTTGTFLALATTTPILPFVAVMITHQVITSEKFGVEAKLILAAALSSYVIAFSGSYMMNYLAGIGKQTTRGEQAIFREGPLAGLIIDQPDLNTSPQFRDEVEGMDYIQRRMELEGRITWMQDYELQYVLKDGIQLLRRIPKVGAKRVIALYPSIFPFALGNQPVTSFPLAAGAKSPSVLALDAVPGDVDIVMVLRGDRANPLLERFGPSLRRNFIVAASSGMWDVHLRRTRRAQAAGPRLSPAALMVRENNVGYPGPIISRR